MWIDRNLFATCSSGLCNRLLVLAGSMRIAERTGRRLALYWPVNQDLGCRFNDLFQNTFPLIDGADLKELFDTTFTAKIYNAWKTEGPIFRKIRADGDPDTNIIIIKGWSYPMFDNESYSRELDLELRRALLSLVPLPEIQAAVDQVPLPDHVIGVHIRRGDHADEFGQSRDEHFMALMHALLRHQPGQHFFLCTDSAATEQRFQAEFGTALHSIPKRRPGRDRADGVREGLIDLLTLARTSAILGNIHSSFSQTAGRLGDRRMIVVDANSAISHQEETCAQLLEAAHTEAVLAP